jgi:neutral trehalase
MPANMKKLFSALLICFSAAVSAQMPAAPDQVYGDLFKAVQMNRILPDGKTFVDCTPKRNPKDIMNDYARMQQADSFNLAKFVTDNFEMPKAPPAINYIQQEKDVKMHIKNLWGALLASARLRYGRKFTASASLSIYCSGWPVQGNVLLGYYFHYAWIKGKW